MMLADQINTFRDQSSVAAARARRSLQDGLRAAANGAGKGAQLADRMVALMGKLGSVALRGSQALAVSNLHVSKALLLAAQQRLEQAAAAESIGAAVRNEIAAWPATRKRVSGALRSYRDSVASTVIGARRAASDAFAGPRRTTRAVASRRRRRARAGTSAR